MGDKHKVPPAPYRRHRELQMLDELPPAAGVVLWQYVRHLRDWVETPAELRPALFHPQLPPWVLAKRRDAAAEVPELAGALATLASFTAARPGAEPRRAAAACQEVAEWAEQRQHVHTAVEYAEAAAGLEPDEPCRANAAGRLTRNCGDFSRAEIWFERGIGLARHRGDRVEYTRGHLGAGILCMATGREGRARRHLNRASNIAMRDGHEWLAAEAQHDLFHFMTVHGHYTEAEIHARRALRWYPTHHARFPLFVADVSFLLVCQGHFSAAAALLREVLRVVTDRGARLVIVSLLVRAHAGAGRWKEFELARARLLKLLATPSEWEAAARWNLAEAERSAGGWDAAESSAKNAVELARARHDSETERFARRLLSDIAGKVPAPAEAKRTDDAFRIFVTTLTTRLSEWAPTRRGRAPTLTRRDWAA